MFWKDPLDACILGNFVWNCHSWRKCVQLWGVLCTLSIFGCLPFLGGVTGGWGHGQLLDIWFLTAEMPRELHGLHAERKSDHGCLENYIMTEDFQFWEREREEGPAEELLDVTPLWVLALCHTAQGWEVEKGLYRCGNDLGSFYA